MLWSVRENPIAILTRALTWIPTLMPINDVTDTNLDTDSDTDYCISAAAADINA